MGWESAVALSSAPPRAHPTCTRQQPPTRMSAEPADGVCFVSGFGRHLVTAHRLHRSLFRCRSPWPSESGYLGVGQFPCKNPSSAVPAAPSCPARCHRYCDSSSRLHRPCLRLLPALHLLPRCLNRSGRSAGLCTRSADKRWTRSPWHSPDISLLRRCSLTGCNRKTADLPARPGVARGSG